MTQIKVNMMGTEARRQKAARLSIVRRCMESTVLSWVLVSVIVSIAFIGLSN